LVTFLVLKHVYVIGASRALSAEPLNQYTHLAATNHWSTPWAYSAKTSRKYFLDVSQQEQRRRFEARINDPIKHWKLSPMDTESVRRWWDYTAAYQRMIEATHTPDSPWHIVPADNKRRARLNLIRHLLNSSPYTDVGAQLPKIPKPQPRPREAEERLNVGQRIPSHY
jgi:polyphosphate kinase 2 (PPK2 family)